MLPGLLKQHRNKFTFLAYTTFSCGIFSHNIQTSALPQSIKSACIQNRLQPQKSFPCLVLIRLLCRQMDLHSVLTPPLPLELDSSPPWFPTCKGEGGRLPGKVVRGEHTPHITC